MIQGTLILTSKVALTVTETCELANLAILCKGSGGIGSPTSTTMTCSRVAGATPSSGPRAATTTYATKEGMTNCILQPL
jgi:hypothetical protein